MNHFLPLLAMLMASATTPLPAQDGSSDLNPPASAARPGLFGPPNAPLQSGDAAQAAARFDGLHAGDPEPLRVDTATDTAAHPVRRPVMRPRPRGGDDMRGLPGVADDRASLGTRFSSGGTVIVAGADTALTAQANRAAVRISGA